MSAISKYEYMGYTESGDGEETHILNVQIEQKNIKVIVYYNKKKHYSMLPLEDGGEILSNEHFREICTKLDEIRKKIKEEPQEIKQLMESKI